MRRAEETLQARAAAEAAMDEATQQDATLSAAEAPLPQYFATDDESSSDDEDFVPTPEIEPVFKVRRSHDDEAVAPPCQARERLSHRFPRAQPLR
jgi:hypothetical protein